MARTTIATTIYCSCHLPAGNFLGMMPKTRVRRRDLPVHPEPATQFWLLLDEAQLQELQRGDVPCYVREQAVAMLRFANGEPPREYR